MNQRPVGFWLWPLRTCKLRSLQKVGLFPLASIPTMENTWADGLVVREADASEAGALVGLINRAFEVERFFLHGDRTNSEAVRELFAKGHFLVAEDNAAGNSSGLAGCVYIEIRGVRAYLGLLSIEPRLQRRGLGLRLTTAAEDFARELGCDAMDLRIVSVREELPAFYQRAGYVEIRTEPFPAEADPQMPCHFIVMSKALR